LVETNRMQASLPRGVPLVLNGAATNHGPDPVRQTIAGLAAA
jgi:hypothetical protein